MWLRNRRSFWIIFIALALPLFAQSPIRIGQTVTGSLARGAGHTYTFEGSANDRIVVHLTELQDYGGNWCCCFDQQLEIRDDADQLIIMRSTLVEQNNCGNQLRTQVGQVLLPRTGLYKILVRDVNNDGNGLYALFLQSTKNPAVSQSTLVWERPRTVAVARGAVETLILNVQQRTRVRIQVRSQTSTLVPRLALYDPDGELVGLPDGSILVADLFAAGKYTLLVFGSSKEEGIAELVVRTGENLVLPHIMDGGGWRSSVILANLDTEPAPFEFRFWSNLRGMTTSLDVRAWDLQFDKPTKGTIPVGGTYVLETAGVGDAIREGWGELISTKLVSALAVFRSAAEQEATVAGTISAGRLVVPFDHTRGYSSGLAIVNSDGFEVASIDVSLRNEAGGSFGTERILLGPGAHDAFDLAERFPQTRNRRGVAEFSTTSKSIAGIGLRFAPGGAFTSVSLPDVRD